MRICPVWQHVENRLQPLEARLDGRGDLPRHKRPGLDALLKGVSGPCVGWGRSLSNLIGRQGGCRSGDLCIDPDQAGPKIQGMTRWKLGTGGWVDDRRDH